MNEDKDDELTPEELEELNNIFGLEGEAALTNEDIKEMTNAFDSLFTSIANAFMAESIKHTQAEEFKVDTAKVYDRPLPYEIAVCHKNFNNNNWIVVGTAKTKEEALKKHDALVNKMHGHKVTYIRDIYDNIIYLEDKNESKD